MLLLPIVGLLVVTGEKVLPGQFVAVAAPVIRWILAPRSQQLTQMYYCAMRLWNWQNSIGEAP